jgi:outer membrane receptor for ferrienterochelin and colicins
MRKIYTLLLLIIAATASAQEDTTNAKQLDEVVVTGQFRPQSMKNSVQTVRTITKERIQKQGATKLQDVLSNELNIRFSQDVATGGSDITMLGLPGKNVKILIDGLPVIGRQGTSNEININQIDINTIERIEIVEGPMSVVYGADALAGVINIITKKSAAAKFAVTARVQEETVGKEYGVKQGIHNQYVGASFRYKNWEIGGGFGYNYFGGWKDTAIDRELVWHMKDQITGNGYIGFSKGRFSIRYRFDGLDEIIYNPGNFTIPDTDAGDTAAFDQEYMSRRLMQQIQSSYTVNKNLSFSAQASYTDYHREVFSTQVSKHTGVTSLSPVPGSQTEIEFKGFSFRGSALYRLSSVVAFQPGVDVNLESGDGERLKEGNNKVNDYAFYLSSEITPGKKINIRPGIRIVHNSVYDAPPVIPSINTKFVLSKNLALRLSYAYGFRAPTVRELYFNFFDANHNIIGNPDLKAETSNSFTGSLTWSKVDPKQVVYTTVLGGFYNDVKNLIDYAISAADPNVFQLTNIYNSKTAGVSLTTIAKYKQWNVSVGFAYTGFYNDYSESDPSLPTLQWSPEANTSIGYSFRKIGLDANFFYKFTGKKPSYVQDGNNIVAAELESYHLADFTLNKKLFKYFSLSAGVRNIFDVARVNNSVISNTQHGSNGARNIAYGRSYFAGLVFNWEKK